MPAIPIRWTSKLAPRRWSTSSQQQPDWKDTAIIVTWDDSDGWYDHAYASRSMPSFDAKPTS